MNHVDKNMPLESEVKGPSFTNFEDLGFSLHEGVITLEQQLFPKQGTKEMEVDKEKVSLFLPCKIGSQIVTRGS